MKANIRFTIEIEGEVTQGEFKQWLDFQFGIVADIPISNPLHSLEIRDAEIPPYYKLEII